MLKVNLDTIFKKGLGWLKMSKQYKEDFLALVIIKVDFLNSLESTKRGIPKNLNDLIIKYFKILEPQKLIGREFQLSKNNFKTSEKKEVIEDEIVVEEEEEGFNYVLAGTVKNGDTLIVAVKHIPSEEVFFMKEGEYLKEYKLNIISGNKIEFIRGEEKIELFLNKEGDYEYEK